MEVKKRVAREIVGQFHGEKVAKEAEVEFERVFQRGERPEESALEVRWDDLPFVKRIVVGSMDAQEAEDQDEKGSPILLATLVSQRFGMSMSEARRLIAQGAVSIDDEVVTKPKSNVKRGDIIRVGKHRFLRIVDADM
jgi:tyrosyl-tRNA synthetase